MQGGAVRNAEDLSRYVVELLTIGIGERDAVAAGLAHDAYVFGSLKIAFKADRELEAMKLGRESRAASRQMGRQIIRLAAGQRARQSLIEDYLVAVEAEQTPGHLAVTVGLTLAAAGWSYSCDWSWRPGGVWKDRAGRSALSPSTRPGEFGGGHQ